LAFATAAVQRRQGRWTDALANFMKAVELDPKSNLAHFSLGETYQLIRDYPHALRAFDEAIGIAPDVPIQYVSKAEVLLASGASIVEVRSLIRDAMERVDFIKLARVVAGLSNISNFAATPAFLLTADPTLWPTVEGISLSAFGDTIGYYHLKAELYREERRPAQETAYLDSARAVLESQARAQPEEADFHTRLGLTYAYLHREADAVREGEAAVRLLPVSREAYRGPNLVTTLALIYTLAGRQSEAIDRLEYLLSIPSLISRPLLRVDPRWAPLRANPRFQKLVARN
jgi:tetratricopeptide (TPR) repeat protein